MKTAALTLLALACCALPAQEATTLKIGTWNLEFLGADPKYRRDTPPRDDADYQKIGAYVRQLGVAALGVQEICGSAALEKVAAAAGPTWRAVLGTSGQWTDGKTQQGVGFLYDTATMTLVHCEELLDFPSELDGVNVFHRKPVTACFRHNGTGADFRAVVVHLKAGRKDRDLQKRRAEAGRLRQWIGELQTAKGEDQDIVILGDFNSTYGDDPEQLLEQGGAMRYLEHRDASPTILWFDTPIDQMAVAKGFTELADASLVAHSVSGEQARAAFRKTYSDHFAVTTELVLMGDDDPDASFRRGPQAQWLPVTRRPTTPAPKAPAGWPLPVGAKVSVHVIDVTQMKSVHVGALAAPMPKERGWVVIEVNGKVHAFSMENVIMVQQLD